MKAFDKVSYKRLLKKMVYLVGFKASYITDTSESGWKVSSQDGRKFGVASHKDRYSDP